MFYQISKLTLHPFCQSRETDAETDLRMLINYDAAEWEPLPGCHLDLKSNPLAYAYLSQRFKITTTQTDVANTRCVSAGLALPGDFQRQWHALFASTILRRIVPWLHCLVFHPEVIPGQTDPVRANAPFETAYESLAIIARILTP